MIRKKVWHVQCFQAYRLAGATCRAMLAMVLSAPVDGEGEHTGGGIAEAAYDGTTTRAATG
ncbi:hypothetical protein ACFVS9_14960 [Streptomyces sp. NPDC058008]|uniref:hypothetical protein n=1 Tax=Streptomyces sp. NPDC058008 TaxID=3346303 RepID=UPI0036EA89AF